MNLNTADALAAFIKSVRAKAFEDVIALINSDAVTKGEYDDLMIDPDSLAKLIWEIDADKPKKQRAALKDEGEAEAEISFDEIRDPPHDP
jgi:hypothetical protein